MDFAPLVYAVRIAQEVLVKLVCSLLKRRVFVFRADHSEERLQSREVQKALSSYGCSAAATNVSTQCSQTLPPGSLALSKSSQVLRSLCRPSLASPTI